MDFIIGFPNNPKQHDEIKVVVDNLRKVVHFVSVKSTNLASDVAQVFLKEIVGLHGVSKKIISDRDSNFTSKFWRELFAILGIELAFSIACHPQANGETKRTNKILEDMLRMYIMHQPKKSKEYLPLVQFS